MHEQQQLEMTTRAIAHRGLVIAAIQFAMAQMLRVEARLNGTLNDLARELDHAEAQLDEAALFYAEAVSHDTARRA